ISEDNPKGNQMGQSKPYRATALVVEDDPMQREMICVLLEESDYAVIQCESAEAAELVLDKHSSSLALMITDVSLAGQMSGVELARIATARNPGLDVIVTSGRALVEALGAPRHPARGGAGASQARDALRWRSQGGEVAVDLRARRRVIG